MAAMKSVHSHTVKNCWIACKILTLPQMQELESGERHNNRTKSIVTDAVAGVSSQEIEELSSMLSKLGKCLSQEKSKVVSMVDAVDLIDMELEREVFDPPATGDGVIDPDSDNEGDEGAAMEVLTGEEHGIDTFEEGDVDEKDPTPTITLAQAKDMSEKLIAFVSEHCALVKQAGTKLNADYMDMADTLRFTIQRMSSSRNTRKTSISEYFSNTVSS